MDNYKTFGKNYDFGIKRDRRKKFAIRDLDGKENLGIKGLMENCGKVPLVSKNMTHKRPVKPFDE